MAQVQFNIIDLGFIMIHLIKFIMIHFLPLFCWYLPPDFSSLDFLRGLSAETEQLRSDGRGWWLLCTFGFRNGCHKQLQQPVSYFLMVAISIANSGHTAVIWVLGNSPVSESVMTDSMIVSDHQLRILPENDALRHRAGDFWTMSIWGPQRQATPQLSKEIATCQWANMSGSLLFIGLLFLGTYIHMSSACRLQQKYVPCFEAKPLLKSHAQPGRP